jgi:hypothetical protein
VPLKIETQMQFFRNVFLEVHQTHLKLNGSLTENILVSSIKQLQKKWKQNSKELY